MKFFKTLLKIFFLGLLIFAKPKIDNWLTESGLHANFVEVLVSFLIFFLSAQLVVDILSWFYRRGKRISSSRKDNVLLGLQNIYYLLLTGAIVITLLGFLGVDFVTLFTSLSIVAAAIAIISRDYILEIIGGIIISFSSEVRIGDYVNVGNHKGKVVDINLTKIALINEDDDIVFISNNKVYTSDLINYTRRQIRRVSIDFEMDLKFLKTIEELEINLIQTLEDYHEHIEHKSFNLKIVDIRKDYLTLKFQYILDRVDRELEREIRKKTVRRIINYIKVSGDQNSVTALDD